jgi:hypothetical protein
MKKLLKLFFEKNSQQLLILDKKGKLWDEAEILMDKIFDKVMEKT